MKVVVIFLILISTVAASNKEEPEKVSNSDPDDCLEVDEASVVQRSSFDVHRPKDRTSNDFCRNAKCKSFYNETCFEHGHRKPASCDGILKCVEESFLNFESNLKNGNHGDGNGNSESGPTEPVSCLSTQGE